LGRRDLFDSKELLRLQRLIPELRKILRLRSRIIHLDIQNARLRSLLDAVNAPVMLAKSTGHLLHANKPAVQLLRSAEVLRETQGRLAALTEHGTDALRSLLLKGRFGGGGSIPLCARDANCVDILIVPTFESHGWAEGSEDCSAVFVVRRTRLEL